MSRNNKGQPASLEERVFALKYRMYQLANLPLFGDWLETKNHPRIDHMHDGSIGWKLLPDDTFVHILTLLRPIVFGIEDDLSLHTVLTKIGSYEQPASGRIADAAKIRSGFLTWQSQPLWNDDKETAYPWDITRYWYGTLSQVDATFFPDERMLSNISATENLSPEQINLKPIELDIPAVASDWQRVKNRINGEFFHGDVAKIIEEASERYEDRMWVTWGIQIRAIRSLYFVTETMRLILDLQKSGRIPIHPMESKYANEVNWMSVEKHEPYTGSPFKSTREDVFNVSVSELNKFGSRPSFSKNSIENEMMIEVIVNQDGEVTSIHETPLAIEMKRRYSKD